MNFAALAKATDLQGLVLSGTKDALQQGFTTVARVAEPAVEGSQGSFEPGIGGWGWLGLTTGGDQVLGFGTQAFEDKGFVGEIRLTQVGGHGTAKLITHHLIKQFQQQPVVVIGDLQGTRQGLLEGIEITTDDLLQVGDGDADDTLGSQDAIALLQELGCLSFREVFEQMGVVDHIKG